MKMIETKAFIFFPEKEETHLCLFGLVFCIVTQDLTLSDLAGLPTAVDIMRSGVVQRVEETFSLGFCPSCWPGFLVSVVKVESVSYSKCRKQNQHQLMPNEFSIRRLHF